LLNEYSVYWIKKEFALHYYHKSGILYRFLRDYQDNYMRQDLSEQFHYVTNTFPKSALIKHIEKSLLHRATVNIHTRNEIEISTEGQFLSLYVNEKVLKLYCESLHDAEELLFPALRRFQSSLFIKGNNIENYGWIAPVQKNPLSKDRQILYSYN